MNEFEWRRQMRELRQPLAPSRDLWASIDAALDQHDATAEPDRQPRRQRHHWLLGAGVAAAALLAVGIGYRLHMADMTPHPVTTTTPAVASAAAAPDWKPDDPRLAGAAIELTAARLELQQAIQQTPDSAALQRLLSHTEQQQSQLRQMARQAG